MEISEIITLLKARLIWLESVKAGANAIGDITSVNDWDQQIAKTTATLNALLNL